MRMRSNKTTLRNTKPMNSMFNKERPIKNSSLLCKYICAESQIVVQIHKVDLDAAHLQQNLDWVHPTPQAGRHLLPFQPTCPDPTSASILITATPQSWSNFVSAGSVSIVHPLPSSPMHYSQLSYIGFCYPRSIKDFRARARQQCMGWELIIPDPEPIADGWGLNPKDHDDYLPATVLIPIVS